MKLNRRSGLLLLALIIPVTFAGAHVGQRYSAQSESDREERRKIGEHFANAILVAKDNYGGQVDFDKLTKSSIVGMLRTLDPHSMYFDRQQWEDFQNDQHSRYYGIGSTIIQHNDKVYIVQAADGTASMKAGLRYGDQIVEVNGDSTAGWTSAQVRSKLIGPEGTPVTIKVARLSADKPVEFKLTRGPVSLPSLSNYFMLGNGIGYINLDRGFNTTTFEETERALKDLRRQGMSSLIFDLRGNRGGLVDQAWRVSNLFLYRGQKVLAMRGRPLVFPSRDFSAYNSSPDDSPIVVLIDRGTASAAEIVAGALQDHDRARLVGENSFGKGLVQNPFTLSDGSAIVLTTGHYYTPSGRLIQRDYSNRSFYDYYLKRGDGEAAQHTDEKHTDSGRTVYGGGGIEPDVEAKLRFPANEIELQRVWVDPIFQFVRALAAGQISSLPEFRVDHPADHSHHTATGEYQVTDKVVAAFKAYLQGHRELKADDARIDKDIEFVKRWMRYEMLSSSYGVDNAYQALLEGDLQMQRAITELPKARVMAEDIRRLHASRDGDLRRNN